MKENWLYVLSADKMTLVSEFNHWIFRAEVIIFHKRHPRFCSLLMTTTGSILTILVLTVHAASLTCPDISQKSTCKRYSRWRNNKDIAASWAVTVPCAYASSRYLVARWVSLNSTTVCILNIPRWAFASPTYSLSLSEFLYSLLRMPSLGDLFCDDRWTNFFFFLLCLYVVRERERVRTTYYLHCLCVEKTKRRRRRKLICPLWTAA